MEIQVPLRVRDIKGKFEKLAPPDSPRSPSSQRRRRTPFSTIDPSPNENDISPSEQVQKDTKFLAKTRSKNNYEPTERMWTKRCNNNNFSEMYPDEYNKQMFDNEDRVDCRNRSHSVGSLLGVGSGNETKTQSNSQTLLSRNQSLNEPNREVKVKRNDEMGYPNYINNYDNFSSFSEKQKLVESIVMNIKNSKNLNKENRLTTTAKHLTSATKENNITSKLEKDIKNAIERGVRILGAKNTRDKCPNNDRQVANTEWSYKSKCETTDHFKTSFNNRKSSLSKLNAILGEYVYPNKDKNRMVLAESKQSSMEDDNEHSSKKWSPMANDKSDNVEIDYCVSEELNINAISNSSRIICDTIPQSGQPETISSPLRPPRKRSPKKKGKAPEPPLTPDRNIANSFNSTEIYSSLTNEEINYADISCHSLEINSQIEFGNNIIQNHTRMNNEEDTHTQAELPEGSEASNEDLLKRRRTMSEAIPPKKPPRTFAHDIYQVYKQESMEPAKSECELSKKLTPEEIESLYTKPLKRNRNKMPDIQPSSNENKTPLPKPAIAPKPVDIMTRARQRYSVVEPLSSSITKEFAEPRPAVKRNSSFRFSFKKSKKSTISYPFKQIAIKTDSPVGRRFKQATRQWHHKKNDRPFNDKQVRIKPRIKSDEVLHKGNDEERIYAVPINVRSADKQQPELHYMCSPLFADNRVDTNLNISKTECSLERDRVSDSEDSPNLKEPQKNFQRNTRGRLGLMDGLKEEWRQSYRFVQKRLKKGFPTSVRKL